MVAGVAVLRSVDAAVLQILLTVTVVISLVLRHRASASTEIDGVRSRQFTWPETGAAGVAAGVLTTTTSTAGPPLVLLLLGRGLEPLTVRDTLTTAFTGLALLAVVVLAATGTDGAVPHAAALAALIPLAAAGQLLGRPLFARLAAGHYELALTITLVISATVGLISALAP
jgi:hypothetical protein